MRKPLLLIIVSALMLAIFQGCGRNATDEPAASADEPETSAETPETGAAPEATPSPVEDASPYNFAVGNYEVNELGNPTAPYEYELPISATGETLSFWTTCFTPQYIPEEGYGSMPQAVEQRELTGVNIEYVVVSADTRQQNYSALQAADDLCDIMASAVAFTTGTFEENIENGYWANIYDYKAYCPNYIYQATVDQSDDQLYNAVFYKDDIIAAFYAIQQETFIGTNLMVRGDWLADLGMTNDEIITWDDVRDMLTRVKSGVSSCDFPLFLNKTIDVAGYYSMCSYDTLPYVNPSGLSPYYVVNGKATFSNMNDTDKEFVGMLAQWYREGLLDPGFASYNSHTDYEDKLTSNMVGMTLLSPGEIVGLANKTNDPDCEWVPIHKPLKTPDQTLHIGCELTRVFYGSSTISAKCENIPLAVSWCDWRYSPSGSFMASMGPQGLLWDRDENGEAIATDFALNNPDGLAIGWAMMLYGFNALAEHGMVDRLRRYLTPDAKVGEAITKYWSEYDYDGAYRWPAAAKLTTEQANEADAYTADIATYISENYLSFIDGSKPLSEWDGYVETLRSIGMDEVIAIYQQAYDAYPAP